MALLKEQAYDVIMVSPGDAVPEALGTLSSSALDT